MSLPSPAVRIAALMALFSVAILLLAAAAGFVPDGRQALLEDRAARVELMLHSVRDYVRDENPMALQTYLRQAVATDRDLAGAFVRRASGELLALSGHVDPDRGAEQDDGDYVSRDVLIDGVTAGEAGFAFTVVPTAGWVALTAHPLLRLALVLGFGGFFAYAAYLRRVLTNLDPTAVMPERVRTVVNALVEGIVLVDANHRIVMCNEAFARSVESPMAALIGSDLAEFSWQRPQSEQKSGALPWAAALQIGSVQINNVLVLTTPARGRRHFSVNVTPMFDDKRRIKGALATFDDQTEVMEKNASLTTALMSLEQVRREISAQNEELKALATRDSLTGCLNRRAFLEIFEAELVAAQRRGYPLACIMCDIDHFKRINDRFGHSAGDRVIQQFARVLQAALRDNDHICRYGGEEFCVLLPGIGSAEAAVVAERMRQSVEQQRIAGFGETLQITCSFGVTDLQAGADSLSALIDQADAALYAAKAAGRNRIGGHAAQPQKRKMP